MAKQIRIYSAPEGFEAVVAKILKQDPPGDKDLWPRDKRGQLLHSILLPPIENQDLTWDIGRQLQAKGAVLTIVDTSNP